MKTRADDRDLDRDVDPSALREEHLRAVRVGHGANCSSVGSVVDTLFVTAAVGGALLAAILAALKDEPVRIVGEPHDRAGLDAEEDAP